MKIKVGQEHGLNYAHKSRPTVSQWIINGRPDSLFTASLKTLLELVNAPAGIDKLLFSGKERMTFGTNIDLDLVTAFKFRRTGLYSFAAGAAYRNFLILGMDSSLHQYSPQSSDNHARGIITYNYLFCKYFFQ